MLGQSQLKMHKQANPGCDHKGLWQGGWGIKPKSSQFHWPSQATIKEENKQQATAPLGVLQSSSNNLGLSKLCMVTMLCSVTWITKRTRVHKIVVGILSFYQEKALFGRTEEQPCYSRESAGGLPTKVFPPRFFLQVVRLCAT